MNSNLGTSTFACPRCVCGGDMKQSRCTWWRGWRGTMGAAGDVVARKAMEEEKKKPPHLS